MDFLTLIFLFVAAVIFFRLRSVLGTRTGQERQPLEKKVPAVLKRVDIEDERKTTAKTPLTLPIEAPRNRLEGLEEGSPAASSLQAIADADPAFRLPHFLNGAKAAYELIVTAFARGDRAALRTLLSSDILETFEQDVAAREKRGEKVDMHFIGIDKAEIAEAVLTKDVAQITVNFVSKLVQSTLDANGKVIEGDAVNATVVRDRWTFERKTAARDPNWKLVGVEDE